MTSTVSYVSRYLEGLGNCLLECLTGAKRREWMGCWGLLGFLSTVSQWIIPSNSLAQVSYSKLGKAQHGRRKANVEKMAMFHAFEAHRMIGIQD